MTQVTIEMRAAVVIRAAGRCEYCRMPDQLQVGRFHVEHIVPESRGGETSLDNLASACPQCNLHKWAHVDARGADTGETVPLYNPRIDRWDDHFQWSDASPFEIEGRTPCGRATVVRLQLNDPRVVTIRRKLSSLGISLIAEGSD